MNSKLLLFSTSFITFIFLGWTNEATEIDSCFLNFKDASDLITNGAEKFEDVNSKRYKVETDSGKVEVNLAESFLVSYYNVKKKLFVFIKVSRSENEFYELNKIRFTESFRHLVSHNKGMETNDLVESEFNGYKVHGFLYTKKIETTWGFYEMFPGNGIALQFYFNGIVKKADRTYETVDDYKRLRDRFMDEYTKHLMTCKH
ncbi:MAG: hypothetical protein NT126_07465 [Bacteroidetes bacterium]|nr:hypothetical protein [Bacteroidota bacterium]